jgi:ribosomal-protein-alanine N-acetyltransferase
MSKEYIEFICKGYQQLSKYDWGIELKELNQVIGSIGAVRIDEAIDCVHIGYCIGAKWWNKGLMTEAFKEVIRFFMEEVKVNRIESRFDPNNSGSGKVMKKCGLTYEGTHRQSDRNNQGICDASWYALLKNEYRK